MAIWRNFRFFVVLGAIATLLSVPADCAPEPVDETLPLVGTGGHGHTYPGATVPFGFVQLSPDTRSKGWDACSGYHYSDSTIMGFSHTHLSGTGCADFGDLLVMPLTGSLNETSGYQPLEAERFQSPFTHENEVVEPGYYRVWLDKYGILAELTATAHAGMHRYVFPVTEKKHLLLDLVHGIGSKPVEASLVIENSNIVSGYRRSDGWANGKTIYFVIECSEPFSGFGLELNGLPVADGHAEVTGRNVRGHLDFPTTARQIVLRAGLSPTDIGEARKNLQSEIPSWDFGAVRQSARAKWKENLSRIRIESPDANIRQTFYAALYHTMTAPTLYNNADGSYRGPDLEIHPGAGFQYYSTFSLWDTFRAEHPLLTLIEPERVNDFIQSMLAFYQQSSVHALPVWPLASYETWCMNANHPIPVILNAYNKGFRGFDAGLAFQAMRETAMSGRRHQDEYQKFGYIPAENGQRNEASARTLELTYDDWCIAQMAKALGKKADAEFFARRAQNFTNVFDPAAGFFRGKTTAGAWREPFNPRDISFDDFTEGNAWQYAFAELQDVPAMIKLYGGEKKFISKLDLLFNDDSDMGYPISDVTGIIGQYAHGNEPCHHVAYLYALAGAQYKTAKRVRQIQLMEYDNTPEGICGNDDCGQMSAWYVWSVLGLYPVNPMDGIYVVGSPLVERATIQLDPKFFPGARGGTFTIIAHDASRQNCYVQSVALNGNPLNRPWITHQEISQGGTLEFQMGLLPNKEWGTKLP